MRIIIIDDDVFALKLLNHQLGQLGHADVTTVSCAQRALALIEGGNHFDILMTDLQMPVMDGVELMRNLKESSYSGELILISGEDRSILRAAELLAQAHGFRVLGQLEKPVDSAQLAEVLRRHTVAGALAEEHSNISYEPEEIRLAMARQELTCLCQPQVSLSDGTLTGVEILVRWQHPTEGMIAPDRFISVAEEHGLIDELTRIVLRDVLSQARDWFDSGLQMLIAINVSMLSLSDLEFPDRLVAAARKAGVSPSCLLLEVTESRLMKDMRAVLDILARLRLKYINLSIDDFGTGHSSLAQLRVLPFNELKIDRSFVNGASRDKDLSVICKASLDIAKKLGMHSVAEGVENIEDWHFLRAHGCKAAQGYLIGKPMPMTNLYRWITEWEQRCSDLNLFGS